MFLFSSVQRRDVVVLYGADFFFFFSVVQAEQEERRKLEAEVRKLRQSNGPLVKGQEMLATGAGGGDEHSRAATPTATAS